MDNNQLVYVRESKLGDIQTRWLRELALFYFDIKYRMSKSNKAIDALSHHSYVPGEMDSSSDLEEYETISYTMAVRNWKK